MNYTVLRRVAVSLVAATIALSANGMGSGVGNNSEPVGELIVDHFPKAVLGNIDFVSGIVQDRQGRLLFGSQQLLVYDGAVWSRSPLPNGVGIRCLTLDEKGNLWTGAINELGFYTLGPDGTYVFHSLRDRVPESFKKFDDVWDCAVVGRDVYFICKSSVLCWNGKEFRCWSFPTEQRLFPVRLNDELWFTDLGSGLYRISDQGPVLVYRKEALPEKAPFWLQKDGEKILAIASTGVVHLGEPDKQLASPELAQFLRQYLITSAVRLADGNLLLATFGGLILVTPDGRNLLRVFSTDNGLPTNNIYTVYATKQGGVWCATENSGVFHFNASESASLYKLRRGSRDLGISKFTWHEETLFAATEDGAYRLARNPDGKFEFEAIPNLSEIYDEIFSHAGFLYLGKFGALQRYDVNSDTLDTIALRPAQEFNQLAVSQKNPQLIYSLETNGVSQLFIENNGRHRHVPLADLGEISTELYVDPADSIWVNSTESGKLLVLRAGETNWQNFLLETGGNAPGIAVPFITGFGDNVYAVFGAKAFRYDADEGKVRALPDLPGGTLGIGIATDPGGSTIFALLSRPRNASRVYSIASRPRLEMKAPWTEFDLPELQSVGVPHSLDVRGTGGKMTIWISGSNGMIQIRPLLLQPTKNPAPPWIHSFEVRNGTISAPSLELPYNAHRLVLNLGSPEVDKRRDLWFQTRLATASSDEWPAPSPQSTFEFTNLSEGEYTFAARTINAAGRASEPVVYRFRVLPPWWRSNWAYAGFAIALGGAVFGLVRVREHSIRRRNEILERTVEERTIELKKANAAKDEFLASVSHEIRNPLNGVVGLAAAINPEKLDVATRTHFEHLRHCATHLSGLLEDILDFSKLEAGAVTLVSNPFDLHEMVRSVTSITAAESARAGMRVDIAISPSVPVWVIGDAARIRQIVLNFVINALRYAGRGEVLLTVYSKQSRPEECEVTFAVSDDGPGISAEEQAQLFTRFSRGSAARKSRVGGSGLGLSVCKNLAEKMGGRLWLESEPGAGSTFYVAVPLPLASQSATTVATTTAPHWHALVVDDEAYNRLALASLLESLGFVLAQAGDGAAAIAAAREGRFDVVFLDFDLPDMTGPDISRALRAMPSLAPDMPIIATTAFVTADKHSQCLAAGMNAVITKPITAEKIRGALAHASSAWRSVSPLHPPHSLPGDPLAALKLLATRKGLPFAEEVSLYFSELEGEVQATSTALEQRDQRGASAAAHKLTGRFAFIHARSEEQLSREVESAAVNGDWGRAKAAWGMLVPQLPALRERLNGQG